jgi:hypothetical protein
MLIPVTAVMPSVFVVIPVMIAIIVAFPGSHKTAGDKAEQSQQQGMHHKSVRTRH